MATSESYYLIQQRRMMLALKRTGIHFSDFIKLPSWVKEYLVEGWGYMEKGRNKEAKNSQDRLYEQGLSLRSYSPGNPHSLFPKGLLETKRNLKQRRKRK